ncbi:maltose ABC transporter permease MalF [Carboxydochorda subterranea]|uniref:Maltose/maltodextrin transport system permease protein n=1 Tax=Carboxydichorda subterranea TaxID=3109565 RepID=A0ABZ1BTN4_9FIRM|nr:maltose ABC transporter permease MalF [Limnochorda sp. L945t]WRP16144.1 maltose ABC transporter permease MalF [Limnochorda sp. L945t]
MRTGAMTPAAPAPRGGPALAGVLWLKVLALGTLDALGAWAAARLWADGRVWPAVAMVAGLVATTWIFTSPRAYPMRYIWPGFVFFALLVIYPIGYTVAVAFTDYGTGHMLSKEQVIRQFETMTYEPEDASRFRFAAFQAPGGTLTLVMEESPGRWAVLEGGKVRPADPAADGLVDEDGDGLPDRMGSRQALAVAQLARRLAELRQMRWEWGDRILRMMSLRELGEARHAYRYDPASDTLTDTRTGTTYRPVEGYFTGEDGQRLEPGFVTYVGLDNFVRMVTDPAISRPFLRVFVWTFAWAALTVLLQFSAGLGLAVLLNDPRLKLRNLYRSVLILPYSVPAFISALMWVGLLNTEVGVINDFVRALGAGPIPWLQNPFWARVALFLVNLWLGYPYMMIITLGALQSIPSELYEAALVDGARPWDVFRSVTLPLLMIAVSPLLVGSFAFNFNNFNVIFLVTGGGPPMVGAQTPAGHTDILISYTYRLAFQGGQGTQFGFASAISIVIFLVVAILSAINFRMTGVFEKMSENV